jgi:hypothetical protein
MPMLVSTGSVMTTATSPWSSASMTVSSSFHSMARVVSDGATAGATLPTRATVEPSSARTAKVSSTVPW